MRSTLTTISIVALLALGASSAAARPEVFVKSGHSVRAVSVRSLGLQHRYGQDVTGVAAPEPAAPPVARTVPAPVAGGGFNWVYAGAGAGLAVALLLGAAGVSAARRQPSMPAR